MASGLLNCSRGGRGLISCPRRIFRAQRDRAAAAGCQYDHACADCGLRRLQASEYGVGTYRPGQVDLFAGVLPAPGTFLVKDYFLFEDANLGARPVNAPLQVHTQNDPIHRRDVCRLHDAVADFRRELGGRGDRADAHSRSDLARHAHRLIGFHSAVNGWRIRRSDRHAFDAELELFEVSPGECADVDA